MVVAAPSRYTLNRAIEGLTTAPWPLPTFLNVDVTEEDIENGSPGHPDNCAIARAANRTLAGLGHPTARTLVFRYGAVIYERWADGKEHIAGRFGTADGDFIRLFDAYGARRQRSFSDRLAGRPGPLMVQPTTIVFARVK